VSFSPSSMAARNSLEGCFVFKLLMSTNMHYPNSHMMYPFMTIPIKESPTLYGKDAHIFEQKIANPKPVWREDVLAAENAYNKFMSIAKFPF
jgi:hypothetical protein